MTDLAIAAIPKLDIKVSRVRAPQPVGPCRYDFGDVSLAPGDGPAAVGGDFEPSTIVAAYRAGLFPWPHPGVERLWFSPDPRAILPVGGLHVSQRLARTLRQARFRLSVDAAFRDVVLACADRKEGTWITPNYMRAYLELHEIGWAHSIEVWTAAGALAGGLYGIEVGRMFGAESMFHRVTDASKVAMVAMMQWVADLDIELVDVQELNPHTQRMGAIEIPRVAYLRRLRRAVD